MDKKNLMPQQAQPIERITTGQLPSELMELSEETLSLRGGDDSSSADWGGIHPAGGGLCVHLYCSYDGEDAE